MKIGVVAILTLPLAVLPLGCQERDNSTVDSTGVSARPETNVAAAADADNSRVNVRDRDDATLTPEDQGTTAADRELTQRIRKALVSGTENYSMTAKNIKIITVNGKVTLRGPVKSEAEKAGIVALAKSIAGEGSVEDQLEVKVNP